MAKKRHIPQSADELTAEWFTSTVGFKLGARVVEVSSITTIGEGVGFLGALFRCGLKWDRAGVELPASVIVKIPALPGTNRSSGETIQAYEREIVAYRDLGPDMGLPMPRFFYADFDKNPAKWLERPFTFLLEKLPLAAVNWLLLRLIALSGKVERRYLLVMEDIDDARPPAQVAGGSVDDAHAALGVLARFHAHHWMRSETVESDPILWPLDRTPKVWQASYARNRDVFRERFVDVIGEHRLAALDATHDQLIELTNQLGSAPWTMLHGDYRLDNVLFRPSGDLVVLDFQGITKGRPGWDVAYFITTALSPAHRAEERNLLKAYHDALTESGVSDYSWDMLLSDVEATKRMLAHRMVVTVDTLETEIEGSNSSFVDILVERVVGWID